MTALTSRNTILPGGGEENSRQESGDGGEDAMASTASVMQLIERRHFASTAAICLCTFTHSWLLVSVFPYSGFMVIKLVPGTDEENAGSYAGVLAASFMIGRAITSYGWGRIADIYGRRVVLFVSLVLSAVFSILFGLSSSFGLAFLWRFLLGASNGVAGISKAIVSETAQGNEKLETRGMSLSMGMWAWGFLLSPAISGFISDPIRQYPNLGIWATKHEPVRKFFELFPFFLPNFVSVLLCVIDFIAVAFWVPETLPSNDLRSAAEIPQDFFKWLAALSSKKRTIDLSTCIDENSRYNNRNETYLEPGISEAMFSGEHLNHTESESLLPTSAIELLPTERKCKRDDLLDNTNDETIDTTLHDSSGVVTLSYLWSKTDTRNHLIVYWIFSFVAIAIDEAFPLFCISKEGGLGLSESEIGKLLSSTGFIFAASQYHVYAWIVDRYGLRRSIQLGALLSAPLVTFVPISLLFNEVSKDETGDTDQADTTAASVANPSLTWASFFYLTFLLSFIRIFGLVFFSSITIATNRTVIPSHCGTMNGLSMLGGSVMKSLGPIFAGFLVSTGISSGVIAPKVGAALVFVVIGACSAITAGITFYLMDERENIYNMVHRIDNEMEHDQGDIRIASSANSNNAVQPPPLIESVVHRHSNKDNVLKIN